MAKRRSKAQRRSSGRSRRGGGKSKDNTKFIIGGAVVVGGLIFGLKSRFQEAPPPVALSTAEASDEKAAEPAKKTPTAKVPAALKSAFSRTQAKGFDSLLDLRRIVKEFGGSPEADRAERVLAAEAQKALTAAKNVKGVQALDAITRAYVATVDPEARRALRPMAEGLGPWKGSTRSDPAMIRTYTVKGGDSLARIGRSLRSDWRLIKRLNNTDPRRLRVNQKLRVPRGKVTVLIFKQDFELVIMINGRFLKAYDVATGKNGKTPVAEFTIGNKLVNPDWYSPDGKVYKYGTPNNILGTRWLAFVNTTDHQGFGMHGTKFPESIGTEASMGCIRLRNPDAEEVYDFVPSGSKVRIVN